MQGMGPDILLETPDTFVGDRTLRVGMYRYGFSDAPEGYESLGTVLWIGPWGEYPVPLPISAMACYALLATMIAGCLLAITWAMIRRRRQLSPAPGREARG